MFNIALLWYLLIPISFSALHIYLHPKLNRYVSTMDAMKFAGVGLLISGAIMAAAFYAGKGSKTHDVEIWNGQITGKDRIHDSYVRSYPCNCRQTCNGSGQNQSCTTTCDTCYEDHYTVDWKAYSNVGNFTIKSLDSTSQSVYLSRDPAFYTGIRVGEACATKHSYTNYIKAVPESLIRPASAELKERFQHMIPNYPSNLYDLWKVDRVIPVGGIRIPDLFIWNEKLSVMLKTLGPKKQANVVVVMAKTSDPNYAYALQDAWLNGKKNDVVVVIGAPDFPNKAAWVSVLALTKNELFKIKLRDDLMELDELQVDQVLGVIFKNTMELHERKPMSDFKYLDAEIDPPDWVLWLMVLLVVGSYGGFWVYLHLDNQKRQARRNRYF